MTPKEKAEELVTKYAALTITTLGCGYEKGNPCIVTNVMFKESAKQCALIAVDDIIKSREEDGTFDDTLSSTSSEYYTPHPMYLTYWLQVKQEIEKL